MVSLFNFSSIFPGGSADPICPYVRTPVFVIDGIYAVVYNIVKVLNAQHAC